MRVIFRIAKTGTYNGLEFTPDRLAQMEKSQVPIPLNLNHEPETQLGRIVRVFRDGDSLFAEAELNSYGWYQLVENNITGVSPEIAVPPEGQDGEYILVGAALLTTAQPAIPANATFKVALLNRGDVNLQVIKTFAKTDVETYITHFDKKLLTEENIDWESEWDKQEALNSFAEAGRWDLLAKTCGAVLYLPGEDTSEYPEAKARYRFPMARYEDGKVVFVYSGIRAAWNMLPKAKSAALLKAATPAVSYAWEFVQKVKEKMQEEEKKENAAPPPEKTETPEEQPKQNMGKQPSEEEVLRMVVEETIRRKKAFARRVGYSPILNAAEEVDSGEDENLSAVVWRTIKNFSKEDRP